MRQELDDLNNSLGEDSEGMTVHDKLDILINNGTIGNAPQYIGIVCSTGQTYESFYCDSDTNGINSNYVGGSWLINSDFKLGLINNNEQCIANVNGTFKIVNLNSNTMEERYCNAGDTIFSFARNTGIKIVFRIS